MKKFIVASALMLTVFVSSKTDAQPYYNFQQNQNTVVNVITAPKWVYALPNSDYFDYYKGDAIDVNYEQAKLKARVDAVRKYIMATQQGSTDNLVDYVKVTAQAESLATEATVVFNAAKLNGLAFVADYTEVSAQNGKAAQHYYILFKKQKNSPSLIASVGKGIAYRFDAVVHSAVYPGWGQIRQGRVGPGVFYATTATLAGLAAGTCYVLEKNNFKGQDWKTYRRGATYVAAGIYAMNIVDALIFGHKKHDDKIQFYGNGFKVRF